MRATRKHRQRPRSKIEHRVEPVADALRIDAPMGKLPIPEVDFGSKAGGGYTTGNIVVAHRYTQINTCRGLKPHGIQ